MVHFSPERSGMPFLKTALYQLRHAAARCNPKECQLGSRHPRKYSPMLAQMARIYAPYCVKFLNREEGHQKEMIWLNRMDEPIGIVRPIEGYRHHHYWYPSHRIQVESNAGIYVRDNAVRKDESNLCFWIFEDEPNIKKRCPWAGQEQADEHIQFLRSVIFHMSGVFERPH